VYPPSKGRPSSTAPWRLSSVIRSLGRTPEQIYLSGTVRISPADAAVMGVADASWPSFAHAGARWLVAPVQLAEPLCGTHG